MTTSDIAAALTSAALVGLVATLIIRDRLRERGVAQSLLVADMRARDLAADAWRRERLEHVNDLSRDVRAAFLAQTKDRARQEAAALDDDQRVAEWLEAGL